MRASRNQRTSDLPRAGAWQGWLASCLLVVGTATALAFPTYDGCSECHGDFNGFMTYESLHDGTQWGVNLMEGHLTFTSSNCGACHKVLGPGDVLLNDSMSTRFPKSCVGCHGRDEDVTGMCTDEPDGTKAECGSGAGLRLVHESSLGEGTCSSCHSSDPVPVGEHVLPFNYGGVGINVIDPCDADGSEGQVGPDGLDNDGDGPRDAEDTDCQAQPGLVINAGLNDAWFNLATAGQGFFFTVFPKIKLFFLAWFTYDTELVGEEVAAIFASAGHRWLTAIGSWEGDTVTLIIELTSGGVLDSEEPVVDQDPDYGTITIVFHDCSSATLTYDIPSLGLSGTIELERLANDNVALCEALQAS